MQLMTVHRLIKLSLHAIYFQAMLRANIFTALEETVAPEVSDCMINLSLTLQARTNLPPARTAKSARFW